MSFSFDGSQFDPTTAIKALPAGWRPVIITGHTIKGTKANDGSGYLQLNLKDTETGDPAFWILNLWNKNPQAKDIAERELSAIVHVTLGVHQGRLAFQSPDELNNVPFFVMNAPDKEGRNDFKGVKDVNGNDPVKGQVGGSAQAPAGQPGPGFGAPAQQAQAAQPQPGQFPGQPQPQPSGVPATGAPAGPFGGGQPAQAPTQAPTQPAPQQQDGFPAQQPVQGNAPGQWTPPGQGGAPGAAPWGGGQ